MSATTDYDVIVIGGGPTGLTAGIYLSRAKVKTLVIDQAMVGGQMILTYEVANYPGVELTSGYQLSQTMRKQAESFGAKVLANLKIKSLDLTSDVKRVELSNGEVYTGEAVILATGGRSREIGAVGENEFKGRGISYCATCDGEFYSNREIIVVGGGNSALEEADALTKYASKVTVVHMLDHWQAFSSAVDAAENNPKIDFMLNSRIVEFMGETQVNRVKIENVETKEIKEIPIDGVFIFIGYAPNTEFLDEFGTGVKLNERGEILTNEDLATNIAGVFAAGDARQKKIRQITTSVADGTVAAINATHYIENK